MTGLPYTYENRMQDVLNWLAKHPLPTDIDAVKATYEAGFPIFGGDNTAEWLRQLDALSTVGTITTQQGWTPAEAAKFFKGDLAPMDTPLFPASDTPTQLVEKLLDFGRWLRSAVAIGKGDPENIMQFVDLAVDAVFQKDMMYLRFERRGMTLEANGSAIVSIERVAEINRIVKRSVKDTDRQKYYLNWIAENVQWSSEVASAILSAYRIDDRKLRGILHKVALLQQDRKYRIRQIQIVSAGLAFMNATGINLDDYIGTYGMTLPNSEEPARVADILPLLHSLHFKGDLLNKALASKAAAMPKLRMGAKHATMRRHLSIADKLPTTIDDAETRTENILKLLYAASAQLKVTPAAGSVLLPDARLAYLRPLACTYQNQKGMGASVQIFSPVVTAREAARGGAHEAGHALHHKILSQMSAARIIGEGAWDKLGGDLKEAVAMTCEEGHMAIYPKGGETSFNSALTNWIQAGLGWLTLTAYDWMQKAWRNGPNMLDEHTALILDELLQDLTNSLFGAACPLGINMTDFYFGSSLLNLSWFDRAVYVVQDIIAAAQLEESGEMVEVTESESITFSHQLFAGHYGTDWMTTTEGIRALMVAVAAVHGNNTIMQETLRQIGDVAYVQAAYDELVAAGIDL